jgi:hypothetical protein
MNCFSSAFDFISLMVIITLLLLKNAPYHAKKLALPNVVSHDSGYKYRKYSGKMSVYVGIRGKCGDFFGNILWIEGIVVLLQQHTHPASRKNSALRVGVLFLYGYNKIVLR